MIFSLAFGLFIFVFSPQILGKEGFKKEILFSHSLSAKQTFVPILRQNSRGSVKSTNGLSLLASANTDKNHPEAQKHKPLEKNQSRSANRTQREKTNPTQRAKTDTANTNRNAPAQIGAVDLKSDTEIKLNEDAKQSATEGEQESNTKQNQSDEMEFLKNFTQEKSSLEIHNKALQLLKADHKEQAILLLKKNTYQNLFLPSYFVLSHLDIPVFFAPFLWPVSLFFMVLICSFLLFLSFKKPGSFHLKTLFWSLSLYGFLIFYGWFFLKQRVSPLQEIELKSSPFMSAPNQTQLSPNSDLIVLKQTKDWLRIQSPDKQTGWVLKQKVLQIF